MAGNISAHLGEIRGDFMRILADDALAKTIAAVGCAAIRHQQQSGLGIFVLKAGHNRVVVLAACIQAARALEFLERRLDNVLELVVVAALLDLLAVERGNVITCDVICRQLLEKKKNGRQNEYYQKKKKKKK